MITFATDDDLSASLTALLSAELEESEFLELLIEIMAETAGASATWLLHASGGEIEVLADDDADVEDFELLASRHSQFTEECLGAATRAELTALELEASPHRIGAAEDDHDPLLDTAGVVLLVPVQARSAERLIVCLFCEADIIDTPTSPYRELNLLAKLAELRAAKLMAVDSPDDDDEKEGESDELKKADSSAPEQHTKNDGELTHAVDTLSDELAEARDKQARLKQALTLGVAVSESLEKEKTAFVLANQLQSYLQTDRVSVLEITGKRARLLAVSGQATFDKRSNAVRAAQQLTRVALKSGEPLWFEGCQDSLAPPVQKVVGRYLDEALAQGFALLPIYESRAPHYRSDEQSLVEFVNPGRTDKQVLRGAILLESIEQPLDRETTEPAWDEVQPQVARSFSNSKRHSDLFLLPLLLLLTKFAALFRGHTGRKAWGMTAGVATLLAAGFLVQTDFRVRCEGHLQPDKMHHVFVKRDGVVMQVLVKEGEEVAAGAPLAKLQNRDLEFEIAELRGELEEKRRAQQHLVYRRLDHANNASAQEAAESYHELAEQTGLVESQITSLEKTLELKLRQLSDLTIRAPFAGQVMGWNVDRRYLNRPLDQGTRLFSLARSEGSRVLELKVPDQRSGYVSAAWRDQRAEERPLPVEFSIASLPDQRFTAEVTHVNPGLEQDSDLGYVMPLEAHPIDELPADLRAGIPVVAKVVCGRRSFIYCKSYEFIDWVQNTTFEYLL